MCVGEGGLGEGNRGATWTMEEERAESSEGVFFSINLDTQLISELLYCVAIGEGFHVVFTVNNGLRCCVFWAWPVTYVMIPKYRSFHDCLFIDVFY